MSCRKTRLSGDLDPLTENLPLARGISVRMKKLYWWVELDELYGYALLGLTMAAGAFDPARGVPFANFAWQKAMFWAIDEMRKDGLLRRRNARPRPRTVPLSRLSVKGELPDGRSDRTRSRMEARDLCAALLVRLPKRERRLILMYYADSLTFRQIGQVLGISESRACLLHQAVLRKLRRLASRSVVA